MNPMRSAETQEMPTAMESSSVLYLNEQDGLDGDFKSGDDDEDDDEDDDVNDFDNLPSVILLLHQDTRLQIFAWLGS